MKKLLAGIKSNRTTWVGILTIAMGCIQIALHPESWTTAVDTILLGIGIITGRAAVEKVIEK